MSIDACVLLQELTSCSCGFTTIRRFVSPEACDLFALRHVHSPTSAASSRDERYIGSKPESASWIAIPKLRYYSRIRVQPSVQVHHVQRTSLASAVRTLQCLLAAQAVHALVLRRLFRLQHWQTSFLPSGIPAWLPRCIRGHRFLASSPILAGANEGM